MLCQFFRRDAEAAQRAEAGVDAVDGAGLRREGLDQLTAAPDLGTGFGGDFTGGLEAGDLPCLADGV